MTAGRSHTHTWSAAAANVAGARDFVALRLAEHGLDSTVPDARLVVSELATNAIRYAGTRFTLTLLIQDGSVLLSVTDPSETWPALAADPLLAADVSPAGGAGMVDGVGVVDGVRMVDGVGVVNGVAAVDGVLMVDGVSLAEGGRGMGIVAALSSSWGVTREPHGGKSVWALITTPAHPDGLGHGDEPGRRGRGPASPAPPRS